MYDVYVNRSNKSLYISQKNTSLKFVETDKPPEPTKLSYLVRCSSENNYDVKHDAAAQRMFSIQPSVSELFGQEGRRPMGR